MIPKTTRASALVLVVALASALATGCNYSYQNAAQDLGAGEIAGQCVGPGGSALATTAVSVKGSALDQPTRTNGWFGVTGLPRGHHVVMVRQGFSRAALRELDLGYGSDGRVEGEWLGRFTPPLAASIAGAFSDPTSSLPFSGVVVDETTGMAVTTFGDFSIEGIAVGTHRIFAATRDSVSGDRAVAGPIGVTIATSEAGLEKQLAPVTLRAATGVTGHLLFRVSSVVSGLSASDAVVRVTDAAGVPVAVPAADSNGDRDLVLPEGLYFVEVRPPLVWAGSVPAPARAATVVIAEEQFDAGTFTLAEDSAIEASARSCRTSADCDTGSCVSGVCDLGYAPPAVAPASVPLCKDLVALYCPSAPTSCDYAGEIGPGTCLVNPASGSTVCVPCSTSCMADATTILTADACP